MFTKIFILVSAFAFASSNVPELSSQPKICDVTIIVGNAETYEKSLCYVKRHSSRYEANHACINSGMKLFNPNSSPEASQSLVQFGKDYLGGSSSATVYVAGNGGNKCNVFYGNGRYGLERCILSFYFLCEYYIKPTVECDSYHTLFNENRYVDSENIEEPLTCAYKSGISQSNIYLKVDRLTDKNNIIALDFSNTAESEHLPIYLAENFPKINLIRAQHCSLSELNPLTFKGLTTLKFVDLDDNDISTITTNIFQDCVNLERIDLDSNPLTTISSNFFNVFSAMDTVWLRNAGCINTFVEFSHENVSTVLTRVENTCEIV